MHNQNLIVSFKGSQQFKEWFDEFARFTGLGETNLVENSLRSFAVANGFRQPPKRAWTGRKPRTSV